VVTCKQRFKKLENQVAEATFLAMAGLKRLKMDEVPRHAIEVDDMLPCRGAREPLALSGASMTCAWPDMLAAIHDHENWTAFGCGTRLSRSIRRLL
jgi:hydroxymethylbilane synthase